MLLYHAKKSPDDPYLYLLEDVNFTPVFILGYPRSGTTLLHNLLVQAQCFNFVTAYHVIKQDEILFNRINGLEDNAKEELNRRAKSLGINTRMIDEISFSPDMPEEYGFVLRKADVYKLSSKSVPRFIEFCKKVQFVSRTDRQLLLKSPMDYVNFVFIKSTFPEAKFVFIHRNPIHMINSVLKAARSSLATMNPALAFVGKDYRGLFEKPLLLSIGRFLVSSHLNLGVRIITRYFAWKAKYFLQNIASLPEADYVSVRYEDLCEEPETNIARILEFLRAKARTSLSFREVVKPRPVQLLEEVKGKEEFILNKFADYLTYCKYDLKD